MMVIEESQLYKGLECHRLDDTHQVYSTVLPIELRFNAEQFDALWDLHPLNYTEIMIHGRKVLTPRWQQAYGRDYQYSGQANRALPVHPLLEPLLHWSQSIHRSERGIKKLRGGLSHCHLTPEDDVSWRQNGKNTRKRSDGDESSEHSSISPTVTRCINASWAFHSWSPLLAN